MAMTPLVDVSVTTVVPVGPVLDGDSVEVMVLPAEFVVVTMVPTEIIGPPGDVDEVARNALILDSSAATWVDQAKKSRYQ